MGSRRWFRSCLTRRNRAGRLPNVDVLTKGRHEALGQGKQIPCAIKPRCGMTMLYG